VSDSPLPRFPFDDIPPSLQLDPRLLRMQADEPVAQVRLPSGDEVYVVTRYQDVRTTLTDGRFSRAAGGVVGAPSLMPGAQGMESMFNMDPPDHTRIRGLVSRAFTVRRVELLRPQVMAIMDELLDAVIAQGPPADLVAQVSRPLTTTVICTLLGVPVEERSVPYEWVRTTLTFEPFPPDVVERATNAAIEYFLGLIERRRERPEEDLLTGLVQVHDDDGDRLTQQELLMTVMQLFGAGQETTSHHLAQSVLTLFANRSQWERLVAEPGLVPAAVEELLRRVPLIEAAMSRVARVDIELSGCTVPAGASVFAVTNMANQDPSVFPDPERFDLDRPNAGQHLAFGQGAHFCLGASLARLELQTALTALVTRLPKLRLAVEESALEWNTDGNTRGLLALPVTW
jgi:cytochrome P450